MERCKRPRATDRWPHPRPASISAFRPRWARSASRIKTARSALMRALCRWRATASDRAAAVGRWRPDRATPGRCSSFRRSATSKSSRPAFQDRHRPSAPRRSRQRLGLRRVAHNPGRCRRLPPRSARWTPRLDSAQDASKAQTAAGKQAVARAQPQRRDQARQGCFVRPALARRRAVARTYWREPVAQSVEHLTLIRGSRVRIPPGSPIIQ